MAYSEKMRQLAYPFLDKRSLWLVLGTLGLNTLYFGFVLCYIGLIMVLGHRSSSGWTAPAWLGIVPLIALQLTFVVVALVYLGALVATNREGWKRSGRLPALHLRRMLGDGLVSSVFAGLAFLLPYLALYAVTAAMVLALFGVSGLLRQANDGLGTLAAVVGAGGIGLAFLFGVMVFVLAAWTIIPLLQARYAITGEFSSYFRLIWAARAIALAPSRFLLYQMPTLIYLFLGTFLYVVTLGLGIVVLMLFFPFVQLNQAYLMGHYYSEFVDPTRGDVVPSQASA